MSQAGVVMNCVTCNQCGMEQPLHVMHFHCCLQLGKVAVVSTQKVPAPLCNTAYLPATRPCGVLDSVFLDRLKVNMSVVGQAMKTYMLQLYIWSSNARASQQWRHGDLWGEQPQQNSKQSATKNNLETT